MKTFNLTFLPLGRTLSVPAPGDFQDAAGGAGAAPVHHSGKPGSLLDIADHHDIVIDHSCGGFAACSTCHVIVRQGLASCNPISDDENDMLDQAPGLTPYSRLSCQCVPDGSLDLVVEIPSLNRNIASEKH